MQNRPSAGARVVRVGAIGAPRTISAESALIAWAVVWLVFSGSTVFSSVGSAYVRYSAEFLGRINLATMPLVAILAARGATAGWEAEAPAVLRRPLQIVAIALLAWTLFTGLQAWLGWF
jgi:hypothetical protein